MAPYSYAVLSAHIIKELFLGDFAVFHGVKAGLFHGESLAGHWPGLGGDIVFEEGDEAIAVGPGAFAFAAVYFVIVVPPLGFAFDGGDAIYARRFTSWAPRFDADDVGVIE